MIQVVGTISQEVISLLDLPIQAGTLIHLGDSNIRHMKNRHPQDFQKYGASITDILAHPDYVAKNPKDDSIEYVKEYQVEGEYVKVAVRVSMNGTFYARSLYVLNSGRVRRFIERGTLLAVSKSNQS